jgi:hypothetical protein
MEGRAAGLPVIVHSHLFEAFFEVLITLSLPRLRVTTLGARPTRAMAVPDTQQATAAAATGAAVIVRLTAAAATVLPMAAAATALPTAAAATAPRMAAPALTKRLTAVLDPTEFPTVAPDLMAHLMAAQVHQSTTVLRTLFPIPLLVLQLARPSMTQST